MDSAQRGWDEKRERQYLFAFLDNRSFTVYFWGLRILNEKPVFMAFHNGELMGGLPGGLVYGEMTPESGSPSRYRTEEFCLVNGIYDISVSYNSSGLGRAEVIESETRPGSIWADSVILADSEDFQSFRVWVNDPSRELFIQASVEAGDLYIKEIQVKTADNSRLYRILCLFLRLALAGVQRQLCILGGVCVNIPLRLLLWGESLCLPLWGC